VTSSEQAFGIYIHWPFCKAKCPYCDFNSHVRHQAVDTMSFAQGLICELQWFERATQARTVTSIFFGGGTPSLMQPADVAAVLDEIARLWPVSSHVEITMEANPTSVEAENFRGYRSAGVNRVSVGVQALNQNDLKSLGRQHTPEEALKAFRLAAQVFPRVSFDLIYSRPGQSLATWREELTRALGEQQGHMSLYQLTIEPGTAYFDLYARGALVVPSEDQATDMFELTQELTEKAGLAAYEVSNHAKVGQESRHNLLYWRYGEYVGVGPGAHARIGGAENRRAIAMEKYPETWRALVAERGQGIVEDVKVGLKEQASEYLIMGLRISEGIDLARYEKLNGQTMDPNKIAGLKSLGLIRRQGDRLMATQQGRALLNALISELSH
jgi:putative oxygen-independent coproporphyrinogen III oxidase